MEYKGLGFWGIALLLVVSLTGCGADANNGQHETGEEFRATDSSELLAQVRMNSAEQAVQAFGPAPEVSSPVEASGNILDNIAQVDSLTKFWTVLKKSDMVKRLNGTGPYTVFAPSDVAFEAKFGNTLKDLLKPENKERLQALVNTHLIAGKLTIADLEDGATLITAGGQQLKVTKKQGQVSINDAVVAVPDANCRNGVVHMVDKVLEPAPKQE